MPPRLQGIHPSPAVTVLPSAGLGGSRGAGRSGEMSCRAAPGRDKVKGTQGRPESRHARPHGRTDTAPRSLSRPREARAMPISVTCKCGKRFQTKDPETSPARRSGARPARRSSPSPGRHRQRRPCAASRAEGCRTDAATAESRRPKAAGDRRRPHQAGCPSAADAEGRRPRRRPPPRPCLPPRPCRSASTVRAAGSSLPTPATPAARVRCSACAAVVPIPALSEERGWVRAAAPEGRPGGCQRVGRPLTRTAPHPLARNARAERGRGDCPEPRGQMAWLAALLVVLGLVGVGAAGCLTGPTLPTM